MVNFLQSRSIRTKILLIILAAGLPVMAMACFLVLAKYRTDYREAEHAIKVTAVAIAFQHQAQVEGIRNLLITLSQFPEIKRRDRKASSLLLHNILKQNPSSYNIGIADLNGNLIASGVNATFTIGDRKYFKDAVRTKRFSVGEYVISRAVGKPTIHFAQPVLDDNGAVSAVIYATFDLNNFNKIFEAQRLPTGSALNVTDHQGVLIHRYPSHPTVKPGLRDKPELRARMTGELDEGVFNDYGRDGIKRLLAFKRLRLHDDDAPYLYLRVSIPETVAFADVRRFAGFSLLFFIVAWSLALFLSRIMAGRFLVAPLERMALVAQAAKEGDFTLRTGFESGREEIGMLAQSIDAMTESLDARRREREQADTERLYMEQVLRASERRFRELLESMHLVAITLDRDGIITFCNDFLMQLSGWERHEVLGKNWFDLFIDQEDLGPLKSLFGKAIELGVLPAHHENTIRVKNGSKRLIVWDNTLLRDAAGDIVGAASIGMDVTEHRAMEEQLLQSQKMEAIGQLAGGVAHDFNNLLTPIMGYAELIRNDLATSGGKLDRVDRIVQAATKARDLTRQLLSFGRKQTLDVQSLDVNKIVEAFVHILHRTIRENIEIRTVLGPEPLVVRADRTQLEQIIMNLVVNAQDAIDDKGVITIETARTTLNEEYVRQHNDAQVGEHVLLMVSDTGRGIDKEVLNHIFEPFFTTKGIDKGTGLGLATVYGIVKQHNGTIWVHSAPGNGTVFKIFFPRTDAACAVDTNVEKPAGISGTTTGTILLVEDNEAVRVLVHDLLEGIGYQVFAAAEAGQAMALTVGRTIDLLVSDVVMPGMSGPELYRLLKLQQPRLKVLFMTGYANSSLVRDADVREGDGFIQKPFAVEAMARKVAEILGT